MRVYVTTKSNMTLKEKFENAFVSDARFDSENAVKIADKFSSK